MSNIIKEEAFEYFVLGIIKWWIEKNPEIDFENNDLSILKVLKLLFFASAVFSDKDNDGLLNIFDNWVAMPYGHVEKDIFELIRYRKGEFRFFILTNRKIILKN